MNDVRAKKQSWRRLLTDMFRLIGRDERRALDGRIALRVAEYASGKNVRLLLGFAPMSDEADCSSFYREWLKSGKRLALPIWLGGNAMTIREVTSLDDQLVPGRGGILEPLASLPEIDPAALELAICPGRAFSESCGRMGRGAGCYDALLAKYGTPSCGAAYDFQVFPEIPESSGDIRLDAVLTPTRRIDNKGL
jgi:5,10-methenyltetrahydrofolate synthetase